MNDAPFQIAINQRYRDKVKPGDGRFWCFNMTFQNTHLTLPKLLAAIREGYAWTAPHHHKRHHRPTPTNPRYRTTCRVKANVIGSQLLALDSDTGDERSQFDTLLVDPLIGQYAGLLHATASSTSAAPRTRVVFLLDQQLEPAAYEQALRALLYRYPFCDQSVNHAAAVFYGTQNCSYQFYQVGDRVRAVVNGQIKAAGLVARLRETTHWEYELDTRPGVWFARPLLVKAEPDEPEEAFDSVPSVLP